MKLPLGFVMDAYGPRVTAVAGCAMMVAGALALALGDKQSLATVGGGYFLLGAAGPFVQMPTFPFSAAFPDSRASVLSLLITCFELSTGVFVLFNELFFRAGVAVETMFLGYAAVGLGMAVTAGVLWPDHTEEEGEEGDADWDHKEEAAGGGAPEGNQPALETIPADSETPVRAKPEELPLDDGEYEGLPALWTLPWWRQMATPEFAYVAVFLGMHVFRQGFTLTTMLSQLRAAFPADGHLACSLADTFSVFLPLGFLPILLFTSSGANAYLLNRPALSFVVATAISMAWGLLFLVPSVPAYIAIFLLFPVARQFVYSTFFAYAVSVFGYQSFGRISGMACTLAGGLQFAQVPLVAALNQPDSALRWEHANAALGLAPALLLLPILWEAVAGYCARPKQPLSAAQDDPERADSVLTPMLTEREGSVDEVPRMVHFARTPSSQALAALRGKAPADGSAPMDVPNFGGWQVCASMASSLAYSSYTSPQPGSLMGHAAPQGGSFTTSLYGNLAAPNSSPPPSPAV